MPWISPFHTTTSRQRRCSAVFLFCKLAAAALVTVTPAAHGEPGTSSDPPARLSGAIDPFDMLALDKELRRVARQLHAGQLAVAEKRLRQSVERHPQIAELPYVLAIVLVRQSKLGAALDSLSAAIDAGFGGAERIRNDRNLAPLHSDPRFARLLERAGKTPVVKPSVTARPSQVADGIALVSSANTLWDGRVRSLRGYFKFAPQPRDGALVQEGTGTVARMLNRWYARGRAAGNHGDLYDNRDRNHSNLKARRLPQIAYVEYSEAARAVGADYRLNTQILFNAITIGNSSLALTAGPLWRSQPRLALTDAASAQHLFQQYANNHLYVYPEHRDHDSDQGDLFPANTPYMIISQGSSGSDQPFVHALGAILAGLRPETKDFLRRKRLIGPTVQMIFRRGSRLVASDNDYMTGPAHPSVFRERDIDLAAMIERANALAADDVPPLVVLKIVEQSSAVAGIDHFANIASEHLFDTPGAIARTVRSTAYTRRLVVSAKHTRDPNGRRLTFHWVVLRGDAARIAIKPLNEAGSTAELIVPWHDRAPVPGRPDLVSDRVDIAVFADNGSHVSAPALISLVYPADQLREYDSDGRIARIDYRDPDRAKRYVDPLLYPARDWIDVYDYDTAGRLIGWSRRRGSETARYTRHGARVVDTDPQGRPARAMAVRYSLSRRAGGRSQVIENPTEKFFHYAYQDLDDRRGTLREQPTK